MEPPEVARQQPAPNRFPFLAPHADGTALRLHVQPRASRTRIIGPLDDRLKLCVTAPPVDGQANAEVRTFLRRQLRIPKANVIIVRGAGGRQKDVVIYGLEPAAVAARLEIPG